MSTKTVWKVVQVPTALGIVAGHEAKVLATYDNKEDADENAYVTYADEPAPDKENYYHIKVVEVKENVEIIGERAIKDIKELLHIVQRVLRDQDYWNGEGYPRKAALDINDGKIEWASLYVLRETAEKYMFYKN